MSTRGLLRVADKPVETIIFIISTGLFLFSVYFLSPIYVANYDSPFESLATEIAEALLGAFFLGSSIPGLIFPFLKKKTGALRAASMLLFLSFFFLAVLRIIVIGWTPVLWIPQIVIALSCGVLRLYFGVHRE